MLRTCPSGSMIDVSHDNSAKDPTASPEVARAVARQVAAGDSVIKGLMIESFLVAGRRDLDPANPSPEKLVYGQSITDGCLGWETDDRRPRRSRGGGTRPPLRRLSQAAEPGATDQGMRIAVIGLGLIGGSIALAARERLGAETAGWDLDPSATAAAAQRGAIGMQCRSVADAVGDADAAFVAAPVGALPDLDHGGAPVRGRGVRRHRRRLDQARDRRLPGRSEVRRRSPARGRRDRRHCPRPSRPVRRRHLVSDTDDDDGGAPLRAPLPVPVQPGSPPGRDRRRRPRRDPGAGLAIFPTCLRTCSSIRPQECSAPTATGCRRPVPASATRPGWREPTARSGPTSTCANSDALVATIDQTLERLEAVRAALRGQGRGGDHQLERSRGGRSPRAGCSLQVAGATCTSCASPVPNSPGVVAAVGARARAGGCQHHRHGPVPGSGHERGGRRAVDRRAGGVRSRAGAGPRSRAPGGATVSSQSVTVAPGMPPARWEVRVPGSKSITNRALLLAGVAVGRSVLTEPLRGRRHRGDGSRSARARRGRGTRGSGADGTLRWIVDGLGGPPRGDAARVLRPGRHGWAIPGADARRRRGHFESRCAPAAPPTPTRAGAGRAARAGSEDRRRCLPAGDRRKRACPGGVVEVDASVSSQFLSGLMMAAPFARGATHGCASRRWSAAPIWDLTVNAMRAFGGGGRGRSGIGAAVAPWRVRRRRVRGRAGRVDGLIFPGQCCHHGHDRDLARPGPRAPCQGDIELASFLERMGCTVATAAESSSDPTSCAG